MKSVLILLTIVSSTAFAYSYKGVSVGPKPEGEGYSYQYSPPQSGYVAQPSYGTQPGYVVVPSYPSQPSYSPQPGYVAQPSYPSQLPVYSPQPTPGYPAPPAMPGFGSNEWVFQEAYKATNGSCNTKENPHSYSCTKWNYDGNPVFPLNKMDWYGIMQGEWFAVTYVNSQGNTGPEFYMGQNPSHPQQPMGIFNQKNNTQMGSMWINGDRMEFANWMGGAFVTDAKTFRMLDEYTVEMQVVEGQYVHLFRCRDFNRNGNHHYICQWHVWFSQQQKWAEKGYMGFLTRSVWDNFISKVH